MEVLVEAAGAFILFGIVALPIILLVMFTVVPPEAAIPLNMAETVVDELSRNPEITLLAILIVLLVPPPVRIPIGPPVFAEAVNVIPGVEVTEPIMFPVIVPTFALPFAILIPSIAAEPVLAVVMLILVMVLF